MTKESQAIEAASSLLDPADQDRVGARFDGAVWIVTFLDAGGGVDGRASVNSSGVASVYDPPPAPSIPGTP